MNLYNINTKVYFLGFILLYQSLVIGQSLTRKEYISMYSQDAVFQMHKYKIPASITMAQGILESNNGNSRLAVKGNNHFGIKCHDWTGKKMYEDDDKKNECFRKYNSALESFEDHSKFLKKYNRYAFLFDYKITDYKSWAKGLSKAGYATNKKYADILIKLIEENKLHELDQKSKPINFTASSSRSVYLHPNNIRYVIAIEDDSYLNIAKEFDMRLWQLYKYNDTDSYYELTKNEKVFIQPKRNKAKAKVHLANEGDSFRSISQLYGVKLKKLQKRNKHLLGHKIKSGYEIKLR